MQNFLQQDNSALSASQTAETPATDAEVIYCPAENYSDIHQAFSLAYAKYRERELTEDINREVFFGFHHILPQAATLVGKLGTTVFATLTAVADGPAGLPLDNVFHDELEELREKGYKLGELGLFADRRRSLTQSLSAIQELFRMAYWYQMSVGCEYGVIGVHPRHSAFYERLFGFETTGIIRDHPTVRGAPAELLLLEAASLTKFAARSRFVRAWLDQKMPEEIWETRYRLTIRDLINLTDDREAPYMLDLVLPYYYLTPHPVTGKPLIPEDVDEMNRIRRAG